VRCAALWILFSSARSGGQSARRRFHLEAKLRIIFSLFLIDAYAQGAIVRRILITANFGLQKFRTVHAEVRRASHEFMRVGPRLTIHYNDLTFGNKYTRMIKSKFMPKCTHNYTYTATHYHIGVSGFDQLPCRSTVPFPLAAAIDDSKTRRCVASLAP
jgi:hypothetical protein